MYGMGLKTLNKYKLKYGYYNTLVCSSSVRDRLLATIKVLYGECSHPDYCYKTNWRNGISLCFEHLEGLRDVCQEWKPKEK
jgi:hypothetical protein